MANVKLKQVRKTYDGQRDVLAGIDLDIRDGEFMVLVGPSGCGKSTLLRMLCGLESITSGELVIGDRVVNDLTPAQRGIAMVFQSYALYPHMNVFRNMAFGLKVAGQSRVAIDARVRQAAATLKIDHLLERYPRELSGGQRQRVAIGRAIVREPQLFLFDEPLSNLDAELRVQTRLEIARLQRQLNATIVYVTHDQVEAMTLGDRIVVMHDGHVQQVGTPLELYRQPANRFVAGFIGSPRMNILPARLDAVRDEVLVLDVGGQSILVPHLGRRVDPDGPLELGVRAEALRPVQPTTDGATLAGVVSMVEHLGEFQNLYVTLQGGEDIVARGDGSLRFDIGAGVRLALDASAVHLFNGDGRTLVAAGVR